ncbi:MAG: translation initiation factor IF-3 [Victivallaceae bacterium]|nr:translation initiation factor IF-3 [Victivallaceae bacterium]
MKPNDRSFTADRVRLIGAEGEQLDVVPLSRARELAHESGLDLLLVSDRAEPPVVRLMDYGKLLYEQKKSLKTQRKNNQAQKLKEVKFHVNIDGNDYQCKIKKGLDFLSKGCKLKVTLALRGREMAHQELAHELMKKAMTEFAVSGDAEGTPKLLGRNISVTFSPK